MKNRLGGSRNQTYSLIVKKQLSLPLYSRSTKGARSAKVAIAHNVAIASNKAARSANVAIALKCS